jgi:hypothetical protein
MKKILIIISIALLFRSVHAQTNAPATNSSIGSDFLQLLKDESAFFGTNANYVVDLGAVYTDKQAGALLDFHTPLFSGTNTQVSVGAGALWLDSTFYSFSGNIQLGKTTTLFGRKFYGWAESGPMYNFKLKQAGIQSMAGVTYGFDVYGGHNLYLSGMVGNISDRSGPVYGGAVSFKF